MAGYAYAAANHKPIRSSNLPLGGQRMRLKAAALIYVLFMATFLICFSLQAASRSA